MSTIRSALPRLLCVCALASSSAALAQAPTAVIAQRVEYQLINDPLEALGTLRARETVQITANVSDTVSAVHFDDGDRVQQGQVLVELTSSEESALLAEAEARASEAQRQYQRLTRLVAEGTAAESLLDERRREAETAAAQLDAVRSRLQDRLIAAPFDGLVGLRNLSPGARVAAGDVITTLVDDREMNLDFRIPSVYLRSVGRGTPVEATTPVYPGRRFTGTVVTADSTINPVTRAITVRARVPNDARALVPGMLMSVDLARAERDALVVAEAAIVPQGSSAMVWVVDESVEPPQATPRTVTLGARQPGTVEILNGLSAGELVITHGVQKVRPGATVAVIGLEDGTSDVSEIIRRPGSAPAAD
jgi:membrane fusion protein (multidrug efflux system)